MIINDTYESHPVYKEWTLDKKSIFAEDKLRVKKIFEDTFGGFEGCNQVELYCKPNHLDMRRLFDRNLIRWVSKEENYGKTKVILLAYAGHGENDHRGTNAVLDFISKQ